MFLTRYLPGPAAGEAARFLRAALTGRLFIATEDLSPDKSQTAYGAAYTEALAHLGARLVDPACEFGSAIGHVGAGSSRPVGEQDAAGWLEAHRRFERSDARLPAEEVFDALRESRELRRLLSRDLGARLGADLVDGVR